MGNSESNLIRENTPVLPNMTLVPFVLPPTVQLVSGRVHTNTQYYCIKTETQQGFYILIKSQTQEQQNCYIYYLCLVHHTVKHVGTFSMFFNIIINRQADVPDDFYLHVQSQIMHFQNKKCVKVFSTRTQIAYVKSLSDGRLVIGIKQNNTVCVFVHWAHEPCTMHILDHIHTSEPRIVHLEPSGKAALLLTNYIDNYLQVLSLDDGSNIDRLDVQGGEIDMLTVNQPYITIFFEMINENGNYKIHITNKIELEPCTGQVPIIDSGYLLCYEPGFIVQKTFDSDTITVLENYNDRFDTKPCARY